MQHISEILPGVVSRIRCISELKDGAAFSSLDTAIDTIRDDLERWGSAYEPEERDFTRFILEGLTKLQADATQQAARLGEAMNRRKLESPDPDNDDDPLPPASMARAA